MSAECVPFLLFQEKEGTGMDEFMEARHSLLLDRGIASDFHRTLQQINTSRMQSEVRYFLYPRIEGHRGMRIVRFPCA